MHITGFQKFSLLDYEGKITAIAFTQGCNFRCIYCHNPELIGESELYIPEEKVFDFLKSRIGKLDALTITGGEPTIQVDLPEFIKTVKDMGYLIKLDTNGTNPDMLKDLIEKKLVDYVAMDIKAPLEKYEMITQKDLADKVKQSISILINSGIPYEFRTTVYTELTKEDFKTIGEQIKGAKKYYLQQYRPEKVLEQEKAKKETHSFNDLLEIKEIMKDFVENCEVRGI